MSGNPANLRPAWKPGQSGNPGGRPKIVREMLKAWRGEGPACLALLKRVRDDEGEETKIRLEAVRLMLPYVLGAPPKTLDEAPEDDNRVPTAEEAAAAAAELRTLREMTGH